MMSTEEDVKMEEVTSTVTVVKDKEEEDKDEEEAIEEPQSVEAAGSSAASSLPRVKKRPRTSPPGSRVATPTPSEAAISAAALAAAAQAAQASNLTALVGLLTTGTSQGIPSVDHVRQAALKAVSDVPPYVHLSSRDSAPQLKIENGLIVTGGMRGYRMARASHGVTEGNYYYEVLVLPPPPIKEIMASLPPNVRLGKKLQEQLQEQLSKEDSNEPNQPSVGGNLRIGWSMRTGDLQAPVGYDKWSYGLRDIAGSRIHASRREDNWGGEPFGPGDVVGFAISLKSQQPNHIRFFKNGEAMGHFVVSRGKREGGAAFESIQDGTYYPALSSYMGGTARVNFGPHFIFSPRSLPSGMKLKPVSDLCAPPPTPEEAVNNAMKEKIFKKTDDSIVAAFRAAIETEARIRHEAYQAHMARHVEDVKELRKQRNLSTVELSQSGKR
jgi:Set1/Ash2 histone methyltransferase complex subunit ASH2